MATGSSITLLHLSDLQLGPHHRFEPPRRPGSLLHRLREDLDRMRAEQGLVPDLVLLTGDLTEHGTRSQFTELLSFMHGLLEVTGLEARRLVVVPGNHDINWKLSEAYFAERAGNEEPAVPPYFPKLRHYADFFARFHEGQTGLTFTEAQPWTFYELPELQVVVAAMCSVMAESHRPEDHYGFLGEEQLNGLAGALRPYKERGWLRIGAVHHDPLHPENEAAKQDAKDLRQRLLPYLNLVLHGHLHEEQLGWLHSTVPVLGIGSAGVKAPQRPAEVPNEHQWVRVFADRIAFGTRAYVPDQKRWVGCGGADPEGKAWWVEHKVAFEQVEATFSGKGGGEQGPGVDLVARVEAYRRHWAKAYRREPLFNLATMGEDAEIPAGLDLLHVFMSQRVQSAESKEMSVEHLLAEPGAPWFVLLGGPGAGKSALTRWIMLKLCTPGESLAGVPSELVPVRVELRRFDLAYRAARAAGRPYDFIDYLDDLHHEHQLSLRGDRLRQLAENGALLWLFDGLDEVADRNARREVVEKILSLQERFGGRGLVTSRPAGMQTELALFNRANVPSYTLTKLREDEVERFLRVWYELAFRGTAELGARRLARLKETLESNASLRELCGDPLLLTLVALLNQIEELPPQRHRIYERALDLMAERWEANKGLHATMSFTLAIKKRFLRQLAFHMLAELPGGAGNTVRKRDLLAFAASFCEREVRLPRDDARGLAEQLVAHLNERNYLLVSLGGEAFGFIHRAFLETLAAAEAVDRLHAKVWTPEDIGDLLHERWQARWSWEEPLRLAVAMLEEHPDVVVTILQAILGRERNPFMARAVDAVVFVEACLGEIGQADKEPLRTFAQLLKQMEERLQRAHHGPSDHARAVGAIQLCREGRPEQEWRPVLERLSRSAQRAADRLLAAKALLDEPRIAQLARRSKRPEVRADAARALETLRIYRALLQVGRPRRGIVSLDGTRVGVIEETAGGGSRFTYDDAYLGRPRGIPLSPTLPLRPEPFEHPTGLHPYFENLLPEGWLLDLTCKKLQLDRTDTFGLMLATCADCAGATEIVPEPPPVGAKR